MIGKRQQAPGPVYNDSDVSVLCLVSPGNDTAYPAGTEGLLDTTAVLFLNSRSRC